MPAYELILLGDLLIFNTLEFWTGSNPLAANIETDGDPITDLAAYGAGHNDCQAVTPRLVGGGPSDHPERYAQASPAELGVAIPAVLLQGDQDAIVPPSQAKSLPGARVRLIRGAGHFDLIHPSTAAFDILLTELEKVMNP